MIVSMSGIRDGGPRVRPTFPAKYSAPPWDICRMSGDFLSRAASREATTVDEEVTLMAGIA